jgi:hypothetical protein
MEKSPLVVESVMLKKEQGIIVSECGKQIIGCSELI